jgi:small subunit ribosomal protein S8
MVMTDPIADMLTRIRNANLAYKDDVDMPLSSVKMRVADILAKEGYVTGYEVEGEGVKRTLKLTLKYAANRERTITGIRRISKPGKRVYVGRDEVPRVLGGLGIAILSTSNGVLTDKQARKQGVGGEVLAYVW